MSNITELLSENLSKNVLKGKNIILIYYNKAFIIKIMHIKYSFIDIIKN